MSKCYRIVRLLPEEQDRRPEPDRQVEEAGLREPLLPQMHPDPGHELRDELHLPRAEDEAGGGQDRRVRPLRMQGVLGLNDRVGL